MKSLILLIACLPHICRSAISQPVAPNQGNKADSLMSEGKVMDAIAEYYFHIIN